MTLPPVIAEEKIIAVARGVTPATVNKLAEALSAGELSILEITMEGNQAGLAIKALSGSGMTVGAGTVMSLDQARTAVEAGAEFFVSPHFDPGLARWATDHQIPYLPGVLTPTEVANVIGSGIGTVKLFPASVVGPGMISALHGPFPELSVIPAGGIDSSNVTKFLEAGAVAVGVGGWLTGHPDHATVVDRARTLVRLVV